MNDLFLRKKPLLLKILYGTGIPCSSKVRFMSLHYVDETYISPCFCWEKFEENFYFYKKRWKVKTAFSTGLAAAVTEAVPPRPPQQWGWPCQAPSREPLSISASSRQSSELSLRASVLNLQVNSLHPLARCALRLTASLLYVLSAYGRFHRKAWLLESGAGRGENFIYQQYINL